MIVVRANHLPIEIFVLLVLKELHLGVPGTTLHMDFNFSSTYSESSIMRSTTCSTGRPARFLSTSSLTSSSKLVREVNRADLDAAQQGDTPDWQPFGN